MKYRMMFVALCFNCFLSAPALAHEYGELVLQKNELVHGINFPRNIQCNSLFKIDPDRNVPDMRRDFRNFFCEGPYTLYWDGLPERVVTVFADLGYGQSGGYLILKKTDNKTVWILDLEDFPPNQWVKVPESKDGYGGFEAYYSPGANFSLNVASVKWGKWWDDQKGPANQ